MIVRQRALVSGMTEVAKRIVKKMIGIKPLVGGYPYRASFSVFP